MESIRPLLHRRGIQIPVVIDNVLAFGGLACITLGLYLAWGLVGQYVTVKVGPVPLSPWLNIVLLLLLILAVMWAAVKLPPRLEPPQASPPQQQQQLTPALGMQILSFLDCLKTVNANERARIKVVTSAKYREYSEMVVKGLRLAGFPVIPNEGDSSYLFPATSEFEAVVIRNRPQHDLSTAINVQIAFMQVGITPTNKELPDTDTFNYVQIEIGGTA